MTEKLSLFVRKGYISWILLYVHYCFYSYIALTYSIAYGLLAGIACWIFLQSVFKLLALVGIERPVFEEESAPVDFSSKKEKEISSEEDADKPAEEETPEPAPASDEEEAQE